MNNLQLSLPDKIQEVLQPNQSAIEDQSIQFPSLSALNSVRQLSAQEVQSQRESAFPPLLLDVREPDEYSDDLGHIPGSILIPLKEVPTRTEKSNTIKTVISLLYVGPESVAQRPPPF